MERRREKKYVAQPESEDEEKTESDDNSQFRVVSHPHKTNLEKICDDIKNANFDDLNSINFDKLTREEKNKLEDVVHAMMA